MNHVALFSILHYDHTTYNAICAGSRTLLRVRIEKKSPVFNGHRLLKQVEHQCQRLHQSWDENATAAHVPRVGTIAVYVPKVGGLSPITVSPDSI